MVAPLDPRLVRQARGVRTLLIAAVAVAGVTALLIICQAFLLGGVISRVFLEGASLADESQALVALVAVVACRAVLASLGDSLAQREAVRTSADLRAQLLRHVVALGPVWLTGERRGQIATLATRGIESIEPYVSRYLPQLVIAAVVPLTVALAILTQDLTAAVIVGLTAPLIPVFMVLIGWYTEAATAKQWSTLGILAGHFLDVVGGLPTLKAFGRESVQSERMAAIDARYRNATMGVLRVSFLSSLVLELLATLSVAVVAVSIGLRLVNGSMDLRVGLVVLILAPEVYLPIRQVGAQFHAAADGIDAAAQVFAVLEIPSPNAGTRCDVPAAPVSVRGVSVTYPGADTQALAPVDLTLEPGSVTALVGSSGAGKSTLLAVLQRFVAPASGRVRVGDVDIEEFDIDTWRSHVAVVSQQPVLLGPTVADDVRLRRPGASDAEVQSALVSAGLDPSSLPQGLETPVGDLASDVSAGQRRRIALARILLQPAPVVLLDEPTAGLDDASEGDVVGAVRALADRGSAVLVVAHRSTLIAAADSVVTLSVEGVRS